MSLLTQTEIDALSDGLKRAAIIGPKLPEVEIAAWFMNLPDGPQFWLGEPKSGSGLQPLYYQPSRVGQEPVAWRMVNGWIITQDRSVYREDIIWQPLYLAR